MSFKTVFLSAAFLIATTAISLAQSQPNYGPNAPADADSFGQPPSGAMPPGVPRHGYRAYAYSGHHHYRQHHHYRDWRIR